MIVQNKNKFPSFSIILEIENLATTGIKPLVTALNSLANQSYSGKNANEFILIDNGAVNETKLKEICQDFSWVTVLPLPGELGYYESKMEGAKHTTGEIIIFIDSDLTYGREWLENLLLAFTQNKEIDVLNGETSIVAEGPYALASLLTWSYPAFTGKEKPYQCPNYVANNVCFHREVLFDCPLRQRLPIYRGNCAIHSLELRNKGYKIWKHPKSRTTHPLPAEGFVQFTWRWLLHGRDMLMWYRIIEKEKIGNRKWLCGLHRDSETFLRLISECTYKPLKRFPHAIYDRPIRLLWLPIGIFVIFYFLLCSLTGFFIGLFNNEILYNFGERRLKELAPNE